MLDTVGLDQTYHPPSFSEIIKLKTLFGELFYLFLVLFLYSLQDQI